MKHLVELTDEQAALAAAIDLENEGHELIEHDNYITDYNDDEDDDYDNE